MPLRTAFEPLPVPREAVNAKLGVVKPIATEPSPAPAIIASGSPPILAGHGVCILDSNYLAGAHHRTRELQDLHRQLSAMSVVILAPDMLLLSDLFPGETGRAQERAPLSAALETFQLGEVRFDDRNY